MIPNHRALIDADGHFANEDDWFAFMDSALRLALFAGGKVEVTTPGGSTYRAQPDPDGGATLYCPHPTAEQIATRRLRLIDGEVTS